MTRLLPFALLLLTVPAVAAPVPKVVLSAEQEKEFNRLWANSVAWYDRPASVMLVCRLLAEPKAATEFLNRKLLPFSRTEGEIGNLIARLDSETAAEWKSAVEELLVYDVRLAVSVPAAWELAKTDRQKNRLGLIWQLQRYERLDDPDKHRRALSDSTSTLKPPDGRQPNWYLLTHITPRHSYGAVIHPGLAAWVRDDEFALDRKRVQLGLQVLEQIGTPEAEAVLRRMTTGHADAGPTKDAAEIVARLKAKSVAESRYVTGLRMLNGWEHPDLVAHLPAVVNRCLRDPARVCEFLKTRLRPLKLDAARAAELLTALFSEKDEVWKPAYRELSRYDLRLALSLPEAWERAEKPDHRVRLKWLCRGEMDANDRYRDYQLVPEEGGDGRCVIRQQKRAELSADPPDEVSYGLGFVVSPQVSTTRRWHREESAIHIFDAIGTDDAIAVIKDMATGHADAGPTKAAKEVLKRRGVK